MNRPSARRLLETGSSLHLFYGEESTEVGESKAEAPEVGPFCEIAAELKDTLFREALEQLADEALEAHSEQLAGGYGDRDTRGLEAERLLNEHIEPPSAEAMLGRFFERLEGYEAESLIDMEIDRISNEGASHRGTNISRLRTVSRRVAPQGREAGLWGSGPYRKGAVKLAGKGLAAVGKLVLDPLLKSFKVMGKFLLKHVVKFVPGQLPPAARPFAQKLLDRLSGAVHRTHEAEFEACDQTGAEARLVAYAARLEAEFDVHEAQLLGNMTAVVA